MTEAVTDAILTLSDMTMRFGGLVAVDGVSFAIPRGKITAVIGPNGAGKTTLFNCLTGFYTPTTGKILRHGASGVTEIGAWPVERIVREAKIARTFQNIRLFRNLSTLENVMVALGAEGGFLRSLFRRPGHDRKLFTRALALLEEAGLSAVANNPAGALPYGAQRRLEIARALATGPELLCLDEPAAGLNAQEGAELAAWLRRLAGGGLTVVLIEHDMPLVMNLADHIVVLNYGQKIAEGAPAAIQRDPAVIAAYLGTDESEAAHA